MLSAPKLFNLCEHLQVNQHGFSKASSLLKITPCSSQYILYYCNHKKTDTSLTGNTFNKHKKHMFSKITLLTCHDINIKMARS
jgi:hypothetical protein